MTNPASFRDPSGFVFEVDGKVYRQINKVYLSHYRQLMDSGLYRLLANDGKLINHSEVSADLTKDPDAALTLQPERIPFISYPYEWGFDQLKDAALLTLDIMRTSLDHGMILKDATPYNIQFHKGRAAFIDTASFEIYRPSEPWVAYRQFCECFLFPLYLEHYCGEGFIKQLAVFFHGIPANYTAGLLPWKTNWNLGVRLHVHLQKSVQVKQKENKASSIQFSKQKMLNLINHLSGIVAGLENGYQQKTTWNNYYEETILGKDYLANKKEIFLQYLNKIEFNTVADLGANDGYFSKLAATKAKWVVAADSDSSCINRLYQQVKAESLNNILPVIIDLTNPSPAIGFNNRERKSFGERVKVDLVLALALIHHLCIANNIPLSLLADYFASLSPELIIEFVPKEDEKVQQLLSSREDIFNNYYAQEFESVFSRHFIIKEKTPIKGTTRTLYWMTRK